MTDEPWDRIREILDRALDRPPGERADWLDAVCEDPQIRAEVESLLAAYEEDDPFFETGGAREGARLEASDRPAAGARIGDYRLLEEVGVGGMSVVYRADRTDADVEQTVAVKLLQRRLHVDDAERRFRAERQVLASLDHPNIAQFIDGGVTEGGRPYLVAEYVEGVPITEYAEAHDLGLDARLDLLGQVLSAVQAAHRQLVVHRDLKPSNVMVTETAEGRPQVKLLDFGIAKLLDDSLPVTRPETRTGRRLLSPGYAAPEQIRGEEITTATDVYQLGVLGYELLAGARPFDLADASPTEVERAVVETSPPRPSERAATASRSRALRGDLDTILLTALRKDPERRYGSVEALGTDLERHRRGEPVEARPATLAYRTKKFVGRHRWGVGATAVVVVLVAGFVGLLLRQQAITERQRDRARAEAQTSTRLSSFLVGLFESSNPYRSPDTLTARDLLRRGRGRIDRIESAPAVQARLLNAMGRAYDGLGDVARADSLLRDARSVQRRHNLEDPILAANTHFRLGEVQANQYDWADAVPRYRTALDRLQDRSSLRSRADSLLEADIRAGLGRALRNTGKVDSAEGLVRRALSIRRAAHGADHPTVWNAKEDLAYVLREAGSVDRARRLYRDVLAWQRTHDDSLAVANTLNNLGYLHRTEGRPRQAERRYRESLRIYERTLGPGHRETLMVRGNNLGSVLQFQDDFAGAEALFREQLRAVRDRYPADHWRVGKWAQSLGTMLLYQDTDLAEAEALLREGVRIYEAAEAAGRTAALRYQAALGHCLARRGKFRRARPLLDESHAVFASDSVGAPLRRAHAEVGLGLYHTDRGDYPRAESLLTAAHATLDSLYNDAPGVDTTLTPVRLVEGDLARLYRAWEKPQRASQYRAADARRRRE